MKSTESLDPLEKHTFPTTSASDWARRAKNTNDYCNLLPAAVERSSLLFYPLLLYNPPIHTDRWKFPMAAVWRRANMYHPIQIDTDGAGLKSFPCSRWKACARVACRGHIYFGFLPPVTLHKHTRSIQRLPVVRGREAIIFFNFVFKDHAIYPPETMCVGRIIETLAVCFIT